jgi:hypothetical protein
MATKIQLRDKSACSNWINRANSANQSAESQAKSAMSAMKTFVSKGEGRIIDEMKQTVTRLDGIINEIVAAMKAIIEILRAMMGTAVTMLGDAYRSAKDASSKIFG